MCIIMWAPHSGVHIHITYAHQLVQVYIEHVPYGVGCYRRSLARADMKHPLVSYTEVVW